MRLEVVLILFASKSTILAQGSGDAVDVTAQVEVDLNLPSAPAPTTTENVPPVTTADPPILTTAAVEPSTTITTVQAPRTTQAPPATVPTRPTNNNNPNGVVAGVDTVVKAQSQVDRQPAANAIVESPPIPGAEFSNDLPKDTVITPSVIDDETVTTSQKSQSSASSSMTAIYAVAGVGVAMLVVAGFVVKAKISENKRFSFSDEELATTKPRDLSLERFSVASAVSAANQISLSAPIPPKRSYFSDRPLLDRKPVTTNSISAMSIDDMYRSSACYSERSFNPAPIETLPNVKHRARDSMKAGHPLRQSAIDYDEESEDEDNKQSDAVFRRKVDSLSFSERLSKTLPKHIRDSNVSHSTYSFSEQSVRIDSTLWKELRDSRFDSFEATDAALAVAAIASLHASQDSNTGSDKYDSMLSDMPNFMDRNQ